MVNLKEIYLHVKKELSFVETPDFEAQQIVRQVFDVSYTEILLGKSIEASEKQLKKIEEFVSKRKERYPLQYILGEWDFYKRRFLVGEGVLIPRADTEILVEEALNFLNSFKNPRVLDLCSGSGCIAITLKLEKDDAIVTAVEKYPLAFKYLSENSKRFGAGVELISGDALDDNIVSGKFDLIISNPPYLTKEDMESLQAEVKYEPEEALYGKQDGLYFYREITKKYFDKLNSGGMLAYEIGAGQEDMVERILLDASLTDVCKIKDYNNIIRCVTAKKP